MLENSLIFILFGGAVFYIGRLVYVSLLGKKTCASNCNGGCNKTFEIPIDQK